MDITFHYFAIKTLAKKAGFNEDEAQLIATYSQYIDDFDWITYIDCKNIPDYIKNDSNYDLYVGNILTLNKNFNPAMTGFIGIVDMAFLLLERTQKFTVSPFHFVPPSINSVSKNIRTVPAIVGDGSFISNKMIEARNLLLQGKEDRWISLMRLGMILHTFADTYAHQLFSGYDSWVNDVKVVNVIDNISNENMTKQVNAEISEISKQLTTAGANSANSILPCIGHMWASHTPDLTNVSFEMKYKISDSDNYSRTYVRSNTETFVTAGKEIINFLLSCRGQEPIDENEWREFSERLANAFLFHFPTKDTEQVLANHWHTVFPEYTYSYSKADVEKGFKPHNVSNEESNSIFGTDYTNEFYRYNYIADKLLIDLYNVSHPRKAWWN